MRSTPPIFFLVLISLTLSSAKACGDVSFVGVEATIEECVSYAEEVVESLPAEKRTPPRARRWENAEELIDAAAICAAHNERLTRNDVRSTELFRDARLAPSTMLLVEQSENAGRREETREWEAEVRFGAELHSARERQSDP